MTKKIFIIILLAVLAMSANAGVRISVSTPYGQGRIGVGDLFYITYVITNSNDAPPNVSAPGAKLVYMQQQGVSQKMSSFNGQITENVREATYVATMKAVTEGSYTFGPVQAGGGKSNVVKYTIGKGGSATNSSPDPVDNSANASSQSANSGAPKFIGKGDSNLFLRASVSSTSAYEQEAIVYTVKLYSSYSMVKFVGATAAPKFDGFVVEESGERANQLTFETYNGKSYATAVIARYVIFPQMTGALKVTGNTYTISVDQRQYYNDPYFGNLSYSTPLQLNVTPNDLVVNVKALPEPKPTDFSGGVGKFSISSKLKSSDFKTNQAASIVYTVQGTGNIKYIQLPDMSVIYPSELEVYTPSSNQNVRVEGSNVSGSVTFDYSFMPLEEGEFTIPDVKLVYFNPATGAYETSVARGYTIHVGKGKPVAGASGAVRRFDSKLQPVKDSALSRNKIPLVSRFVYWLFFIIPVVALLLAIVARRRYLNERADMISFYSKKANKIARKRLKKAAVEMHRGNRDKFLDELLHAMWGYIGFKLKMPTSELMRDNIRAVLAEKGIPSDDIVAFIRTIDDAEFAKYSSADGSDDMMKAYEDAASTINRLEDAFKKISASSKSKTID